jgi:L-alanine-DL-glutamate epimerase-like enolase superfamily enzyme
MMDPYGIYNREQALLVGRALDEINFEWFEEPMCEWDIEGLAILADEIKTPVLGPEIVYGSIFSTPEYILRRAVDIVRTGVRDKGGIGPVKKIAGLAEAFGMNCELHYNGAPLYHVANLHVACSIRNSKYHEIMVSPYTAGVVEDVNIDKDGYVTVPNKPGLGLEIDWDYINKHKIYETPPL